MAAAMVDMSDSSLWRFVDAFAARERRRSVREDLLVSGDMAVVEAELEKDLVSVSVDGLEVGDMSSSWLSFC